LILSVVAASLDALETQRRHADGRADSGRSRVLEELPS